MEELKTFLFQGRYAELEQICKNMNAARIEDMILEIAYETDSISVYSFVRYMIEKTGSSDWRKLAFQVMAFPLCFVEGAYSVALFHARELLSMERTVENLDRMLFFYDIPERLLDQKEAKAIVNEILTIEPKNELALRFSLYL